MTADFAKKNPNTVLAITKALIRAGMWLDANNNANRPQGREDPREVRICRRRSRGHRQFDDRHLRIREGRQARRFPTSTCSSATSRPIPYYSDAVWYLTQMRRWGQIPEAKPDSWYADIAKQVYRPDLYLEAAKLLVAEGKAKKEDFPWDSDGYRAPTNEFIDGISFDGRKPNAYVDSSTIGLKGNQRVDGIKVVVQLNRSDGRSPSPHVSNQPEGSRADVHCLRCRPDRSSRRRKRCATPGASAGTRASTARPASSSCVGLGWIVPLLRMAAGDSLRTQARELWRQLGVPLLAIVLFLGAWAWLAPKVQTSLGALPGPVAGLAAGGESLGRSRRRARPRNARSTSARRSATPRSWRKDPKAEVKVRPYTGKPTFIDQIFTSLEDRVHRLRLRDHRRGAARRPVRPVRLVQRRDQSAGADLQAGVAAGLAADRHHGRQRALRTRRPDVSEVVPDLGDHRDAVLAVADADQHARSASPRSTRISSMSGACCGSPGRRRSSSSCCRRRCR